MAVSSEALLISAVIRTGEYQTLAAQGITVDRRRIVMEPVKALGTTTVQVRLATSVTANVEGTVAAK